MAIDKSSFLAGVGTVVLTLTVGFGGGILISDALTGKKEREPNRLERVVETKRVDTVTEVATPAPAPTIAQLASPPAHTGPPAIPTIAAPTLAFVATSPPASQTQLVSQTPPTPQIVVPENTYAKASDADLRRERLAQEEQFKHEQRAKQIAEAKRRREEELRTIQEMRRFERLSSRPQMVRREMVDFSPRGFFGMDD